MAEWSIACTFFTYTDQIVQSQSRLHLRNTKSRTCWFYIEIRVVSPYGMTFRETTENYPRVSGQVSLFAKGPMCLLQSGENHCWGRKGLLYVTGDLLCNKPAGL